MCGDIEGLSDPLGKVCFAGSEIAEKTDDITGFE
jgi:hypothetical protein